MEPFKVDAAKFDKVTRFEVIDEQGRAYVKYDVEDVELVIQD